MLPIDEHSGWCELQGRRTYIEDIHSVVFASSYKLLGVFDGHFGNKVSIQHDLMLCIVTLKVLKQFV
jgi:hypothetical protein